MRVGGGLTNGISALIKEVPQAPHSSCHVRTRREGTSNAQGSGHAATLLLDFQPPESCDISLCCLQATLCCISWQPKWTKTVRGVKKKNPTS